MNGADQLPAFALAQQVAAGPSLTDWIQAISTAVLVGVTIWYAYTTRSISRASRDSAKATAQSADAARESAAQSARVAAEMERTRMEAAQPILLPVVESSSTDTLTFAVRNVGQGPALNVRLEIEHPWIIWPAQEVGPALTFVTLQTPADIEPGQRATTREYAFRVEQHPVPGGIEPEAASGWLTAHCYDSIGTEWVSRRSLSLWPYLYQVRNAPPTLGLARPALGKPEFHKPPISSPPD